jgi:hypothetical protein
MAVDFANSAPADATKTGDWSLATHFGYYEFNEEELHEVYANHARFPHWSRQMRAECAAFVLRHKYGIEI